MAATARVVLGADTLARKWWLDINNGTHAAPSWLPVGGVSDFKFAETKTFQPDSDYDSGGADSQAATAYAWDITCKLQRKVTAADPTIYDPGQEKIRTTCKRSTGIANVLEARWYEENINDAGAIVGPKIEAYQGYITGQWAPDGGAMDALDTISVTFNGRGAYADIAHPDAGQAVPIVYSVSPATGPAAGGTLVVIHGVGFMLAGVDDLVAAAFAGVKFGTTPVAKAWITESDSVVYAITPAVGAGGVSVKCTNSIGASTVMPTYTFV